MAGALPWAGSLSGPIPIPKGQGRGQGRAERNTEGSDGREQGKEHALAFHSYPARELNPDENLNGVLYNMKEDFNFALL